MLSVFMHSIVMLNLKMLTVNKQNTVMLSTLIKTVMLSVVIPNVIILSAVGAFYM
jgi:hypothetical protein